VQTRSFASTIWALCGDFNVKLVVQEREGGTSILLMISSDVGRRGWIRVLWWDFIKLGKKRDFGGWVWPRIATRASASPP